MPVAGQSHPPTADLACVDCHDSTLEHKFIHDPVKEGTCEVCHQVPAGGGVANLTEAPEKLCLACQCEAQHTLVAVKRGCGEAHKLIPRQRRRLPSP